MNTGPQRRSFWVRLFEVVSIGENDVGIGDYAVLPIFNNAAQRCIARLRKRERAQEKQQAREMS